MNSFGHFSLLAAVTTAAGVAMMRIGVAAGLLRARARRRTCSACGRPLSRGECTHCAR